MKEYVIWGIPPESDVNDPLSEIMLVSEKAGLKTMGAAQRAMKLLEEKHGCKKCRVQLIDIGEPFSWNARSMVNA